jgi:hypothetical protein
MLDLLAVRYDLSSRGAGGEEASTGARASQEVAATGGGSEAALELFGTYTNLKT